MRIENTFSKMYKYDILSYTVRDYRQQIAKMKVVRWNWSSAMVQLVFRTARNYSFLTEGIIG